MIEDAISNCMECLSFIHSFFLRFFPAFFLRVCRLDGIMKCNPLFIVLFILFKKIPGALGAFCCCDKILQFHKYYFS